MAVCKFFKTLSQRRGVFMGIFIKRLGAEINPQKEKTQRSKLRINSVCVVNEDTAQGIYRRIQSDSVVVKIL